MTPPPASRKGRRRVSQSTLSVDVVAQVMRRTSYKSTNCVTDNALKAAAVMRVIDPERASLEKMVFAAWLPELAPTPATLMFAASLQSLQEAPVTTAVPARRELTLLELVTALCEETDDDREVVAAILDLLCSGRVRLIGSLRGAILSPEPATGTPPSRA